MCAGCLCWVGSQLRPARMPACLQGSTTHSAGLMQGLSILFTHGLGALQIWGSQKMEFYLHVVVPDKSVQFSAMAHEASLRAPVKGQA